MDDSNQKLISESDIENDEIISLSTDSENISIDSKQHQNPPEIINEISSSENIEIINTESVNTTNCLALTIQKEHKLVAVKNVFIRSIRMSWKVLVSSITLTILKLLS